MNCDSQPNSNEWGSRKFHKGEELVYKGRKYRFDGYDFGTYPYATDCESGEQIQLPDL